MSSFTPRRLPSLRSLPVRRFALSPQVAHPGPIASSPSRPSPTAAAAASSSSSPTTSSVNAAEISHFSKLSAQWWDEHGELALLHKMNPSRLSFLRQKLQESARRYGRGADADRELQGGQWLAGLKVLDVGCGAGLLSESLARLGAQTLGVDATLSNIPLAKAHALLDPVLSSPAPGSTGDEPRLEYRHQTAEDLLEAEGEGRFDVVCAMEVLEHVDDPKGFLLNLTRLVKPGGHIILSTIARTPFAHLLTVTMAEYVLRLVSPGTHHSHKFINPSELDGFFDSLSWRDPLSGLARTTAGGDVVGGSVREARGVAYLPWKGEWELMDRGLGELGKQCNYYYFVRRPEEMEDVAI